MRSPVLLALLLLICSAPACAPDDPRPAEVANKIVLLGDSTRWNDTIRRDVAALRAGPDRLLITGRRGESAREIYLRLPWLLQPGVDAFIVDTASYSPAAADSIVNHLRNLTAAPKVLRGIPRAN